MILFFTISIVLTTITLCDSSWEGLMHWYLNRSNDMVAHYEIKFKIYNQGTK